MSLLKTLCGAALLAASLSAVAQVPDANIILVEQGTHKLFRERAAVTRVAIGDPAIADVNLINQRELLITGKALGVTSLMVWPASGSGAVKEYRIKVGAVKDPLRASKPDTELSQAVVEPGKSLEGKLPNLLAHRRAKQAASNKNEVVDKSSVDLDSQVMTEVKIAEVNRNALQQFGLQYFKNNAGTTAGIAPPGVLSGIEGGGTGFTLNSASGFLPLQNAFQLVGGSAAKGMLGVLSLLERKGLARVLAEPSLVAMSGQTASYLAGGEFPVPVSQGGSSGGITVQYKEFDVRLTLSPTVLARNRIGLKVAPEVSELDFSAGIQIAGVSVPSLTVRRTDTTIELGDGETFAISGLISSNLLNSINKVPGLGDLPVIGAFFRSTSVSKVEKELVMVVTPRLVRPLARGTKLPALPGSRYDGYDPNFAETLLIEDGDFDTGFSK